MKPGLRTFFLSCLLLSSLTSRLWSQQASLDKGPIMSFAVKADSTGLLDHSLIIIGADASLHVYPRFKLDSLSFFRKANLPRTQYPLIITPDFSERFKYDTSWNNPENRCYEINRPVTGNYNFLFNLMPAERVVPGKIR